MSNYLIELAAVHLALTLAYWFFLRKERQYNTMRFYLIASVVLALIIPLIKLPRLLNSERTIDVMPADIISPGSVAIGPMEDAPIWSLDLLVYLYIAISVFFLGRFLSNVLYLAYLRRKSNYGKLGGLYVHKIQNGKTSFSFFNWIFISEDIDKDDEAYHVMLEHEKAHASLGHTYDIIFLQLFKASFWWLPSAWFVNKEIKKIHEYQADAYVLRSYSVDQYSSILISSTLKLNGLGVVSSFHDGLILKRLIAMKQQTKKVSPWKLGALSVLCAVLFTVFACSEEQKSDVTNSESHKLNKDIFVIVEQMPEFKGGINAFNKHITDAISYPSEALQKRIEGRVDVQFVVDKNGSLSDVEIIKGIGAGCDEEALRAIRNTPSFKPGSQNGKPVRVRMVVPIMFKIDESVKESPARGSINPLAVQPINSNFKVNASYDKGEWSGVVYDEEGNGLPGVNIIVAGTTTGTVSDLDGNFKVKAEESSDLNLSFVGYESIRLNNKAVSR
ncbi:MAG TPA: TonB family protein [Chryseolinea sp.]|nr:TonB family protein [Chryseolinea sp.]